MTLTPTNAFGSDGHLRSPQRSELVGFFAVEGMDVDKWGSYRPQDTILEIYAALVESHRRAVRLGQAHRQLAERGRGGANFTC